MDISGGALLLLLHGIPSAWGAHFSATLFFNILEDATEMSVFPWPPLHLQHKGPPLFSLPHTPLLDLLAWPVAYLSSSMPF